MEDFSSLPRLFRDSVVNEVWEGPRNVLLAQVHRDLKRASSWYPPGELVSRLLAGRDDAGSRDLGDEVASLVAGPDLEEERPGAVEACRRWDAACRALLHAFQEGALAGVEGG